MSKHNRVVSDLRAIGTLLHGQFPCNICGAACTDEDGCVNGCKFEEQVQHSMKSIWWGKEDKRKNAHHYE